MHETPQTSIIAINDITLNKLIYQDTPVVTFEMIARVHGVPVQNVQKAFRRHQGRFEEGKHVIRLDFAEASQLVPGVQVSPNGVRLFTERGYLLLVKPMKDDTSWQVQERMIDAYFSTQHVSEALDAYPDLKAAVQAIIAAAEAKQAAQQALVAAIHAEETAVVAQDMAKLALESNQWMTLRQYVFVNNLARQVPERMLNEFARYLTDYCLDHGIPVSKEAVADRKWSAENRYHVGTIEATLPGWLARYERQTDLGEAN